MQILWAVSVVAALAALVGIILLRRKPKATPAQDTLFSTFDDRPLDAMTRLDPLAEADVYLAYGNRQQAVSVLRKAAQEHPGRTDILEKIREIREAMKAMSGE